jgi:hypothetical protein
MNLECFIPYLISSCFQYNLHYGLDAPFANGLENGVISYVHPSWNNGFVNDEPFLFKCHVLCCIKIDDLIVCHMIISTQGGNKMLFFIFHKLGLPFLYHHFSSSNKFSQSVWVFCNKNKPFQMPYEFCSEMWHFFYFHFIVSWKPHETIQQQ